MSRVILPLLVLLSAAPARADLDIEVPIGSPLDWDKELHQPTPVIKTGVPGRKAEEPPESNGRNGGKELTRVVSEPVRPTPPPVMNFSIPNLYNFFRITTIDIMNHIQPTPQTKKPMPIEPPSGETPPEPPHIETGSTSRELKAERKEEAPPAGTFEHGVKGLYPPRVPGELAWISIAAGLRAELHPTTVNRGEAIAYLLEIGEPAAMNHELIRGMISDIPDALPPYPQMREPIDKMLSKIIVLELVSGYPVGMDPTYAKRTMMIGDLAYPTLARCAESGHTFLARNAVAVLANMQGSGPRETLLKLLKTTADPTIAVRAIAGLARKKETKALSSIQFRAQGGNEGIRAMAIYALGVIAAEDAKTARALVQMARTATPDVLWTILAALARIHSKDESVRREIVAVKKNYEPHRGVGYPQRGVGGPTGAAIVDPPNSKERILYDLALLAAGASGDADSIREAASKGLDGFHPAVRIVAAEALATMGPEGRAAAKALASNPDTNIATAAVKAVGSDPGETDWLRGVAASGPAVVRAAALARLILHDDDATIEACRAIVAGYSGGADAAQAFLVGTALQMLDRLDANDGATVLRVVEAAHAAGAVARRTAENEYDVTRAKIDVFPPLLELAVLSLGATGHEGGLNKLLELLRDSGVRVEAALALGSYGSKRTIVPAAEALLRALLDPRDGFVRFSAYLSLKNLSGEDHLADYVFGKPGDIWAGAVRYRDWLVKVKRGEP